MELNLLHLPLDSAKEIKELNLTVRRHSKPRLLSKDFLAVAMIVAIGAAEKCFIGLKKFVAADSIKINQKAAIERINLFHQYFTQLMHFIGY